ncbi:unnamed protein product [Allacma fusca]|uniref:Uncharacterized protein n=1 Tax=Allacma fusca TaxID=39272 RepID=A0A8J2P9E6_9HEXA|nr:unnamed protein product [Allacma fusca]
MIHRRPIQLLSINNLYIKDKDPFPLTLPNGLANPDWSLSAFEPLGRAVGEREVGLVTGTWISILKDPGPPGML